MKKIKPEWLPKELIYPCDHFDDLFGEFTFNKERALAPWLIDPEGKIIAPADYVRTPKRKRQECLEIGSYCRMPDYSQLWVSARKELVEVLAVQLLRTNYRMYFIFTDREEQGTLVSCAYNEIIGDRWLALIDTDSIPHAPED